GEPKNEARVPLSGCDHLLHVAFPCLAAAPDFWHKRGVKCDRSGRSRPNFTRPICGKSMSPENLQTVAARTTARFARWGLLAALLLASGCGRERSYPSRPITLVCPWSVGGGTDRVSRQMAVFLETELGVPVNV